MLVVMVRWVEVGGCYKGCKIGNGLSVAELTKLAFCLRYEYPDTQYFYKERIQEYKKLFISKEHAQYAWWSNTS
jgi:hypothetical protein